MEKNILWTMVRCLMGAALLLCSYAQAAQPAPKGAPSGQLIFVPGDLSTENLDPSIGAQAAINWLEPLYDHLVGVNPDGTLSKKNGIARDWESSADLTRHTFKLRPGVKFHNGDDVTSADTKFSLEFFMRKRSVATMAGTLRTLIKSIQTPDPLTMVVITNAPNGFIPVYLSAASGLEGCVLPSKYIQKNGEEYFAAHPVGSGPYRFVEQRLGSHILYEALPRHWRIGVPKYKNVKLLNVKEEGTRIAMLKTGEADIVAISFARLKDVAGFKIIEKQRDNIGGVVINNVWEKGTYLNDIRVRQALSLAINRQGIINGLLAGRGAIAGSIPYGSNALGYQPLPPPEYNPAKAKKLLAEAYPKGITLNMNAWKSSTMPEAVDMMIAIASMWEKIGVKTNIQYVEYAVQRAGTVKGTLPNYVADYATTNRVFPSTIMQSYFHSKGSLSLTKSPDWDPALENRVNAMMAETDVKKYGELMYQVANRAQEDFIFLPVVESGIPFAAAKHVPNVDMGRVPYRYNLEGFYAR